MNYTYNPNATAATYGENSAANLALQKQLNALGAGLKEDSLYGPLTKAAFEKYGSQLGTATASTPATPNPASSVTVGDHGFTGKEVTPTTAPYDSSYEAWLKSQRDQEADPNKIRTDVLSRFQQEIDATKNVYADRLREAQRQGLGRLGSERAIAARSGTLGSPVGDANTNKVQAANTQTETAIQNELSAALSAIMRDANTTADQKYAEITKAKQDAADKLVSVQAANLAARGTNASALAKYLLSSGIDISTLSPKDLEDLTKQYGVASGDLSTAYVSEKAAQDAAKAKLDKEGQTTLNEGDVLIGRDGKAIYKNPKTYKPEDTGAGGGAAGYVYTPGKDAEIDSWLNLLNTGQAGIAQVPLNIRGKVVAAHGQTNNTVISRVDRTKLAEFNSAKAVLGKLETLISDISAPSGFTRGFGLRAARQGVQQLFQTEEGSKETEYKGIREGFLSTLSRASGEKGVLTDQDTARIKAALPKLNDKPDVRSTKLANLKDIFNEIDQRLKTSLTAPSQDILGGNIVDGALNPDDTILSQFGL